MSHLKYFNPIDEVSSGDGANDANSAAAALLADLENRQEHVIAELDRLNTRIEDVLRELGVSLDGVSSESEEQPWETASSERESSEDFERE